MSQGLDTLAALTEAILAAPRKAQRRLIALAGAPGSGKSTLAAELVAALNRQGCAAQVVPMDGFHLDNRILSDLDLLARKGAPETFDVAGFARLVAALGTDPQVFYPLFDRTRDIAIAGAGRLDSACDTVVVEGNYLLLDASEWRALAGHWDLAVRLEVSLPVLRQRLIDRWLDEGLNETAAIARAEGNDLENARLVTEQMLPSDVVFAPKGS